MRHLTLIMGISWRDKVNNNEKLKRAKASLSETHPNSYESAIAWPPEKDRLLMPVPIDPVFPASGKKAEPKEVEAVI